MDNVSRYWHLSFKLGYFESVILRQLKSEKKGKNQIWPIVTMETIKLNDIQQIKYSAKISLFGKV